MRHRFKRIRDEKIFWTLLYGMFLSAKSGLYKKVHCGKTKHGNEKRFSDMKCTGNLPQGQLVLNAIQILNRAKKFPGVPPLLNFENFEAVLF